MAAVRDLSERCLQALSELLGPGDAVGLFSAERVAAGKYLEAVAQKFVDQMVHDPAQATRLPASS